MRGRKTAAYAFGALAALVAGYALVNVAAELFRGHPGAAARWGTMTFFAGGPLILAYAALRARFTLPRIEVLVVVAIGIALQGILASGSYFTGDDWLHIVRAHDLVASGGLPGIHYLGTVVYIHYAPGMRLSYWALEKIAPLDWAAGQAALLALFAGSILLLSRIFKQLFGERRSNLILLLLFATSILLVTSFLWFADGLHKLPSTFLSLLAIDTYLVYWRTRSKLALAVSVAAVSLGSLFYVKALLVPLYLVLIRVLFLEERPRRFLRTLWAERYAWLAFVPAAVIYLLNYEANYADTSGPAPSLHLLGSYLWVNWFKGVTPALVGVEIGPEAARSGVLFATVAQVALIAVIGYSVYRKRSAWRAWVFWGVCFSVNAALVGLGRLATMGVERVGKELRYDTEMSWLLPLALGFAFLHGTPEPSRMRPRARLAVVGAVAAYLIAAAATGSGISSSWREHNSGPSKAYVENVRHDVSRLAAAGRPLVAIDDQVPGFLIGSADHPLNRLERLTPAIDPRLHIAVAGSRPLQVGDDGHIGAAVLQPLVSGRGALSGAGRLRLVSGRADGGRCVSRGAELGFQSKRELEGQSLYALVSYRVDRPADAPGKISGGGTSRDGSLPLSSRGGEELVNLGRSLRVALPPGARACLHDVAVGWLGSNGR